MSVGQPDSIQRCVLRADALYKSYGATRALSGVSLEVRAGEIRALLGENGAGKSTLVKILSGLVRADAGQIDIDGAPFVARTLMQAREAGVSTAFQELSLLPNLSVADNLMLPRLVKGTAGRATVRANRDAARVILAEFGAADIVPEALVETLSLAQKQRVEILRALSHRPKLLVLDEPTAALAEPQWLFDQVERLAAAGTAILYISHRLAEVRRLCSRATILRNGEGMGTVELADVSDSELFAAMVGSSPSGHASEPGAAARAGPVVLRAHEVAGQGVSSVSLELRRGEIVGVAALEGQGQRELFRMLAGAQPLASGAIEVDDRPVVLRSPADALRAGVAFLPEERKSEGVFLGLPVTNNISLSIVERLRRFGLIDRARERARVTEQAQRVDLSEDLLEHPMSALSGGNQQKALLGRVMLSGARVLLLFDPTRGVDVGTKQTIYGVVRRFVADGGSVLIYSTELEELVQLADRCLVIYRGAIAGEVAGAGMTEARLVALASGHAEDATACGDPAPDGGDPAGTRESSRAAALSAPAGAEGARPRVGARLTDNAALIAAALFAVLFAIHGARVPAAMTLASVTDLLNNALPVALAAAGGTLVVISRGFDLSVAGVVSLTNVLIAVGPAEQAWAPLAALAIVVATGMAVGAVNGALVAYGGLQSVTATLGTMIVCSGIALLVLQTPGGTVPDFIADDLTGTIGSVLPVAALVMACVVAVWFAVRRTDWGVALYAIGADEAAAEMAGIAVRRVRLVAYIAAGALYGLAGYALTGLTASGDPNAGNAYLITTFAAIAIGGTAFTGGRGGLVGGLIGAATLTLLLKVLFALGVLSFSTGIAQGVVMILAVLLGTLAARRAPGAPA